MQKFSSQQSSIEGSLEPLEPNVSAAVNTAFHSSDRRVTGDGSPLRSEAPSRLSTQSRESIHHARRSSISRSDSSPYDSFFACEPPPPNVATAGLRVRQFVRPLQEAEDLMHARVAIVTAGGTDVPLEREPVRFITNVSAGNRGAGLCEQLLRLGYFVIFLTSVRAVKPFVRHLLPPHPMPHILDFLSFEDYKHTQQNVRAGPASSAEEPVASEGEVTAPPAASTSRRLAGQVSDTGPLGESVNSVGAFVGNSSSMLREEVKDVSVATDCVPHEPPLSDFAEEKREELGNWRLVFKNPVKGADSPSESSDVLVDVLGWELNPDSAAAALEVYRQCKDRLLCISYKTLVEYSFLLRAIVAGAAPLKERLMVCSAAAVADFYVPHALMPQHKIRPPQQQEAASSTSGAAERSSKEQGNVEIQGPSRSASGAGGAHPKRWFTDSFALGEGSRETAVGATTASLDHFQQHHHMTLRLHIVPKMLFMVRAVAPSCFLVVFKLETEEAKLAERAYSYLEGGGGLGVADCVIGNTLQSKSSEVTLFTREGHRDIKLKHKQQPEYLGVTSSSTSNLRGQIEQWFLHQGSPYVPYHPVVHDKTDLKLRSDTCRRILKQLLQGLHPGIELWSSRPRQLNAGCAALPKGSLPPGTSHNGADVARVRVCWNGQPRGRLKVTRA
ncbi:hypothetical protein ACSSS7_002528 [Eimeria intestinalis]